MSTSIIVTTDTRPRRRYVVVDERDQFEGIPSGPVAGSTPRERENVLGYFYFGARWVRKLGKVDEMYRSLSSSEITKVERIDTDRVFGSGCSCGCGAR